MPEYVTRLSRIRVQDLSEFEAIHAEAIAAQSKYGVTETVYQSVDDPNSLTVLISGTANTVQAWLESPERAALSQRLKLDGAPESWDATELHVPG